MVFILGKSNTIYCQCLFFKTNCTTFLTQSPLASVVINASNSKDLSRIHAESLHKGTLEWRLNCAIDSGQADLAEKISDSIGDHVSYIMWFSGYVCTLNRILCKYPQKVDFQV